MPFVPRFCCRSGQDCKRTTHLHTIRPDSCHQSMLYSTDPFEADSKISTNPRVAGDLLTNMAAKRTAKLTKDQTEYLINQLQAQTGIWDVSHKDYKVEGKRLAAWILIQEQMKAQFGLWLTGEWKRLVLDLSSSLQISVSRCFAANRQKYNSTSPCDKHYANVEEINITLTSNTPKLPQTSGCKPYDLIGNVWHCYAFFSPVRSRSES